MKTSAILLLSCLGLSDTAYAAQSLTDQINAVDAAQQQHEWAARQAWQAQQAAEERERSHEEAVSRERARATAAARTAESARIEAERQRNESYEDKLRELALQEREAQIQAEKTRAGREGDFIDRELKQKDANADLTQSEADANRNISSGTKSFLEKEGDADIKKDNTPPPPASAKPQTSSWWSH